MVKVLEMREDEDKRRKEVEEGGEMEWVNCKEGTSRKESLLIYKLKVLARIFYKNKKIQEEMTSWDQYLPSLTVDAEKKKITVGGMILDSNGNPLAKSPELDLLAYDHEMELDDGTTKKVSVNEFVILQNRKSL